MCVDPTLLQPISPNRNTRKVLHQPRSWSSESQYCCKVVSPCELEAWGQGQEGRSLHSVTYLSVF